MDDIWFVYDGECPLCQLGASLYRLRQSVGQLHTIDARAEKDHPVMQEIRAMRLDIDEGMVLKYKGRLYQGEEALYLMARLGADDTPFNRGMKHIFKHRLAAKTSYPFMKFGRSVALTIKGVGRIRNLQV